MPHSKLGKVGWVLGGGGCLEGLPQAVQIKEFLDHGVVPDYIVALSVGALNALDPYHTLELWERFITSPWAIYDLNPRLRGVFKNLMQSIPRSPFHRHTSWKELGDDFKTQYRSVKQLMGFVSRTLKSLPSLPVGSAPEPKDFSPFLELALRTAGERGLGNIRHIVDPTPLIEILKNNIDLKKIAERPYTLHFLARSLNTGKERSFHIDTAYSEQKILDAALASSALRPFFAPVLIDGEWYSDIGHINPLPIMQAFDAGCDTVFAFVKNSQQCFPETNIFEAMFDESTAQANAMFEVLYEKALERAHREQRIIHLIKPDQPTHPDLKVLWITPEAVGYTVPKEREATRRFLEKIL